MTRLALLAPSVVLIGLVACGACGKSGDASVTVTAEAGASIDGSISVSSGDGGTTPTDGSMPGAACGAPDAKPGFTQTRNVTWATGKGTYSLFLGDKYDGHTLLPVIFAFHGDGGNGASMRSAGLEQASGGAAIIVYPDGPNQTWDLDDLPGSNPDYVLFQTIVTDIKATLCVDPKHIFSFGFSRGAFFSNQLGCFVNDDLKAIAANSGGGPYDNNGSDFDNNGVFNCPKPPVGAMIIHGTADTSIETGVPYTAGETSRDHWRIRNNCATTTKPYDPSPCVEYDGCPADHPVAWCSIDGMGHQIWEHSAEAVWKFFSTMP